MPSLRLRPRAPSPLRPLVPERFDPPPPLLPGRVPCRPPGMLGDPCWAISIRTRTIASPHRTAPPAEPYEPFLGGGEQRRSDPRRAAPGAPRGGADGTVAVEACCSRASCRCPCLQGLDPASPVVLAMVATRCPGVVGLFVCFQDHGVDASSAQGGEALFGCFQQGGGYALSAVVGVHGQSVGGASPSVEAGYDGSCEEAIALCEEQSSRVSLDESGHSVVVVADARSFRGAAPELQHGADVRGGGVANA